MNRAMMICVTILLAVFAFGTGVVAGDEVKVEPGTKSLQVGPFVLKGPAPQQRPNEFKKTDIPAVFIENEYLRCCVLPDVGGRLYEVYNKASKSQVFFANPYLEMHPDNFEGGHPWNLGGVEVNFPYFHHGNSYNDRWQWATVREADGSAGVVMSFTSRPTMQRAIFRVMLRPRVARVDLAYRFENMNPYSWGLAAWIDTMHPKTAEMEFIIPTPWVAQHGHNSGRTDLQPWPIRDGVDISWQKNVTAGHDLSEFGWMPRRNFHGCYDHAADRGAVRIFNPETLPAAKLWTQAMPVAPDRYYQHFEIWTATSAVMEDPKRQPELSAYAGADSWFQAWGIGGYVFANADLALNLRREPDGKVFAGICGTRRITGCVASFLVGRETAFRAPFNLDPAKPAKWTFAAPPGDVELDVLAPDGSVLAHYERIETELPVENWQMNKEPRWKDGINRAYYLEDYQTLWRRRGDGAFFSPAINGYNELLKKEPESTALMLDLARVHLKENQVRVGYQYQQPGPEADADAEKRRQESLAASIDLLQKVLAKDSQNAHAHLYLGLAFERQKKTAAAMDEYKAALACTVPAPAAGTYLGRLLIKSKPGSAVDAARTAAQAFPQSTRAGQVLMAALIADGQQKQAIEIGTRLLPFDPANPVTTQLLADTSKKAEAKSWAKETDRLLAGNDQARKEWEADMAWARGE